MAKSKQQVVSRNPGGTRSLRLDLPWWYQPSRFLLGVSLPALLLFSFADSTLSLSSAQLFYGTRDLVLGVIAILLLVLGCAIGESGLFSALIPKRWSRSRNAAMDGTRFHGRIAEAFLTERVDWILMAVFIVAHLLFFRGFFLNPSLAGSVLGGDVELKHSFKTIPGVTTWTQVSLVIAAIRGLRWAGVLPGKIKLISVFHLVFFGTLFIRAILWSERLALIEGVVPFFVCAAPRFVGQGGAWVRLAMRFFPFVVPILLLGFFITFEYFRSWQYYSGQHGSLVQFGWLRLFTYYFEAMNTGAATLELSGFYSGLTGPMSEWQYWDTFKRLYENTLDIEFNNPSGIWYLATFSGNLLFAPLLLLLGAFYGAIWRAFREGRILGLFFPINFLGLMEIIRIHYWFGSNRVLASTIIIFLLLAWALFLPQRVSVRRVRSETNSELEHEPELETSL